VLARFFCCRKEHVAGFTTSAAASGEIERTVGVGHVVIAGIAEEVGGAIDRRDRAFQFQVSANGGLIEFDLKATDGWECVGGTEFFVAECGTQSESAKNAGQFACSSYRNLGFVFDLEMAADF